jgi:hypothetical protein
MNPKPASRASINSNACRYPSERHQEIKTPRRLPRFSDRERKREEDWAEDFGSTQYTRLLC